MEKNTKSRNFIKTTIREFLNEQKLTENDKPPRMGTQYNQVKILYKLTNDDFFNRIYKVTYLTKKQVYNKPCYQL